MPRSISFPADPRLSETFAQRLQTRSAGLRDAASGKDSTLQPRRGQSCSRRPVDARFPDRQGGRSPDAARRRPKSALVVDRTLLQVRNKLIEAYRDVLQIQV